MSKRIGMIESNQKRARRGKRAVKAWLGTEKPDKADARDCITDILHYVHSKTGSRGLAIGELTSARNHFYLETEQ